MKFRQVYIILLLLALAAVLLLEYSRPRPVDWRPSFHKNDKIPFGTYVLYRELPRYFPGAQIRDIFFTPYEELDSIPEKTAYLIINDEVKMGKKSLEKILQFVSRGNPVFIATHAFPKKLLDTLGVETAIHFEALTDSTTLRAWLPRQRLTDTFRFRKGNGMFYFSGYPENTCVLGKEKPVKGDTVYTDFIRVPFGRGYFYLHTQPFWFTNYHMLKAPHEHYIAGVMARLNRPSVWWDNYFVRAKRIIRHPLRYVFSQPALKWSWKLLFWSLVVFMLFGIKRTRRPIPVIHSPENKSVEFARTIAGFYKRFGNPHDIFRIKVRNLYEYIREKYGLNPQAADPEFRRRLQARSGAGEKTVNRLFDHIARFEIRKADIQDVKKLEQYILAFKQQKRN
ncbi:MAG: DUF4350 domain-containing protein [Chlorobi bacterium]|nr:DUF4350 domain-containing protein [Chlorobiota bacterium]